MCGIIGYTGNRQANGVLLAGLEKLEYRGYDSAGLAVLEGGRVALVKTAGRLSSLREALEREDADPLFRQGRTGIGHTRWATHGAPSQRNAHPHRAGRVTLVHNGIIENSMTIRQSLEAQGKVFRSDTDTESAVQLLAVLYEQSSCPTPQERAQEALRCLTRELRGSYALAVLFDDLPETVFALRRDSPLVVGLGENETFLASDIPALRSFTNRFVLPEEGELACITPGGVTLTDPLGNPVSRATFSVSFEAESAEKEGYAHFMEKEIHQQPSTLRATLSAYLTTAVGEVLQKELGDTSSIRRLLLVGCGSAAHAGMAARSVIEELSGIPCEIRTASEFRYEHPILLQGDCVTVISQSGETADTLAALRLAKQRGIPAWAVVNARNSSIAREADRVLYTCCGPEIAVATTKAYTAQITVLYLLALRLAADRGRLPPSLWESYREQLWALPALAQEVLRDTEGYRERAKAFLTGARNLFYIGRGRDYATCCEGSLKVKEITYLHSEAYPAGELKHGAISLLGEEMPVVAVMTDPATAEKTLSNLRECKARGARILLLCTASLLPDPQTCDGVFVVPGDGNLFLPAVSAIPLQLFAYYGACLLGKDVDKPRNLAKSVTVE